MLLYCKFIMKNKSEVTQVQRDSVKKPKSLKMIELSPASKIKSKEGAIIPREVLYMSNVKHSTDSLGTYKSIKMTKLVPSSKSAIEDKANSPVKELNINKHKGDSVDTTKVVKMIKLSPTTKIKSEEGAIIPKEALSMTKIQPILPPKKEKDPEFIFYFLTVAVIIAVFIFILKKNNFLKRK